MYFHVTSIQSDRGSIFGFRCPSSVHIWVFTEKSSVSSADVLGLGWVGLAVSAVHHRSCFARKSDLIKPVCCRKRLSVKVVVSISELTWNWLLCHYFFFVVNFELSSLK